jgi:uncharacterized protein with PIN domain
MSTAYFYFTETLKDFLPRPLRNGRITVTFKGRQSLKHLIESLGVPHTEVGELLVNAEVRELEYITQDGDQIEVRTEARHQPVDLRFVLDGHLGRLAAYLRMLGFDCLYNRHLDDQELAELVAREKRVLLTRDRRLLMRKIIQYGYCPRSLDPQGQLTEVVRRFDLAARITPFRRCIRCNHLLEPVSKEAILERLEPLTRKYFDDFRICPACLQIYWKGSHLERMQKMIDQVVKE